MGFFIISWPEPGMPGNPLYPSPMVIESELEKASFKTPILVTYYGALHSQDYWDVYVRKHGMNGWVEPGLPLSGTSISMDYQEWRVISDDNTRQGTSDRLRSMAELTPAQLQERNVIMKRAMVANFQPLTISRDEKVHEVMMAGEWLAKIDETNQQYQYCLVGVIDALEELLPVHLSIIKQVPMVEADAAAELPDTRNGIQAFHRHFRRYIASFLPAKDPSPQKRLDDLLMTFDGQSQTSFIDEFLPFAHITPSYGTQDDVEEERLLLQALTFFDQGDFNRCQEICTGLIQTIGCSLHIQAVARVALGKITLVSNDERLNHLRRALDTFTKVGRNNVPEHLPVELFRKQAMVLVVELESVEKSQQALSLAPACRQPPRSWLFRD